jgi:hypothetical protein
MPAAVYIRVPVIVGRPPAGVPFRAPVVIPIRRGMRGLGATSGVLGPADLYQLALGAGFPSDTAVKMAAIALKESGGNPAAYNGTPPDDSYGLWQINMYGNLGPARMAQFGLTSKSQLFDPATNAAAAFRIWGGNDNNLNVAWAINDGAVNQSRYQANLPVVMAAVGSPGLPATSTPGAPDGSTPAGAIVAGDGATFQLPGGLSTLDATSLGLIAAAAGLALYAIA